MNNANNKWYDAGMELAAKYHVKIRKYRKSMTGVAYFSSCEICTPEPKTAKSFYIFTHEVGHIANGNIKPSCLGEYMADKFAEDSFKQYGFTIPREVKAEMNRYRAYSLAQALNRGLKNIPAELKPYRQYLVSHDAHIRNANGVWRVEKRYISTIKKFGG